MGLTNNSVGAKAFKKAKLGSKPHKGEKIIALAGNPNVGKSTIFNSLTGLDQHTGNWPGKTVTVAEGYCYDNQNRYVLVDLPGTYSLSSRSEEETAARNFICFGNTDAVVLVCDASCLERNLNLVLQVMEITGKTALCVNLLDEAKKKGIETDLNRLSEMLNIPVIGTVARDKKSLKPFMSAVKSACASNNAPLKIHYDRIVEEAVSFIEPELKTVAGKKLSSRWLALKLLEDDKGAIEEAEKYLCKKIVTPNVFASLEKAKKHLLIAGCSAEEFKESVVSSVVKYAEKICSSTVKKKKTGYSDFDRKADKFFTGKYTAFPVMAGLLAVVFWITIVGANYPSNALSLLFGFLIEKCRFLFQTAGFSKTVINFLVDGLLKIPAFIVSVMLPPMAIFFPLFTLLEDSGYLPRVAYNLDKPFKWCKACGKQSLTTCMGYGCNAAGVMGCRIIDSERERLLAILTNSFAPCNGRFPMLITVITAFLVGTEQNFKNQFLSALFLTAIIVLSAAFSFVATKILSETVLKGNPSSFTLELPPYRTPQWGKVIVRSIFDRTAFVLGRAVAVAVPAGAVIWLFANINVGGASLLNLFSENIDPFAKLLGLDGVILMAFIMGFPANETVIPIILMTYLCTGRLTEVSSLGDLQNILILNGWNIKTAVCFIIFTVMHWPCSTTLLTVKKETGSLKWTAVALLVPTAFGMVCCMVANGLFALFGGF